MQIRSAKPADLTNVADIDGTVESIEYLHLDASSGEGLAMGWRLEQRPARKKLIDPNRLDDDASFTLKQVVGGAEEGLALLVEIDDAPVAMLLAVVDAPAGTLRIVDLRVDYDYRRQGMGLALVYGAIQHARESGLRAIHAQTLSNNVPAAALLAKCGFDLSGVDTRRRSNHDLVKESVTLLWYAALD
jgi:RimJ/RimL family protein N-acetyltransferase